MLHIYKFDEMKKIFCILPAVAMLAGCTGKMNAPESGPEGQVLTIEASCCGFSDMDIPESKTVEDGAVTMFSDGDAIGVFGVDSEGNIIETCRNVKCVYDGTSAQWDGKVYLYDAGTKYFAYYPYSEEMSTMTGVDDITAAFAASLSDITDQSSHALYTACDLMTTGMTAPDSESSSLRLSFSHAMSMVEIELPQVEYKVSEDAQPYYSIPVTSSSLKIGGKEVAPFMVEPGVYRFIMVPGEATVSGEFSSLGKDFTYESTLAFTSGRYKRMKITSSSSSIIHTLSVGDFFLKSGALVSKDATLTASEQEDCIGVVFWTSDPSSVDVTLQKDCPGCTHGLVVALDEIDTKWSAEVNVVVNDWIKANTSYLSIGTTGDDANTNNIVGYNNTMAIDHYNRNGLAEAADVVNAVEEVMQYRAANTVDCGASGWYLPSVKELALLYMGDGSIWAGKNDVALEINGSLAKVEGAVQLSGDYWSNTETAAGSVHRIESSGKITSTRVFNVYKVRPVMAF